MMNVIKKSPLLILVIAIVFFACEKREKERLIELAPRPMGAIMQDQVRTVQIAIEEKKNIAVLFFENRGERPGSRWLSYGLMRIMTSSLQHSRDLAIPPAAAVREALDELGIERGAQLNARARLRLAEALKVDVIVSGYYAIRDDSLMIQVALHKPLQDEVEQRFTSVARLGDMKSIASSINKISWQIRNSLTAEKNSPAEISRSLADVSTGSLDAYKYYLEGLELSEQFKMPDAMQKFRKAIAFDSTFASAYLSLTHAMISMGLFQQAKPILKKAVALSEHVPERERLPILAMDAMINGRLYEAVAIYNKAVELFPEDDEVHYELGNYYFSIANDYKKAIEKYETTIQLNPRHKLAHNNLAYCYAATGEIDRALYILREYERLAPDEPNPQDSYGEIAQRSGLLQEAVEKYKAALDADPNYWPSRLHLVSAYLDLGKYRKAKSLLKKILKDSLLANQRMEAERLLAYYHILKGDIEEAEAIFKKHVEMDSTQLSPLLSLLMLKPGHEPYRQQYARLVERQLHKSLQREESGDYLFALISTSLLHDVAVDDIDKMLDMALKDARDPIPGQAALAYKQIIDIRKGRPFSVDVSKLAYETAPQVFQYASPITWNDYWRHYFDSIRMARERGMDVTQMTDGFARFSSYSGNEQFKLQGALAVAAGAYYNGEKERAEKLINALGIPCEANWTFIGPFEMRRGFHQQFWPEKRPVDEWAGDLRQKDAFISAGDGLFDGYIDLKSIGQTSFNQAMYALLRVNSPTFQDAQLRIGCCGRLKAWINGDPVMVKNQPSRALIDQYSAPVQLRPGENWVLLRVNNPIGEIGFYFRLTDPNGLGLDKIKFEKAQLLAEK